MEEEEEEEEAVVMESEGTPVSDTGSPQGLPQRMAATVAWGWRAEGGHPQLWWGSLRSQVEDGGWRQPWSRP